MSRYRTPAGTFSCTPLYEAGRPETHQYNWIQVHGAAVPKQKSSHTQGLVPFLYVPSAAVGETCCSPEPDLALVMYSCHLHAAEDEWV